MRGNGFTVSVPDGWTVARTDRSLVARSGDRRLSVTVFTLLKSYDPARFAQAARELDGIAAKLAAQAGGKVTERTTTTVGGRKVRAYRYVANGKPTRIGFVLVDKREYQLLCTGDTGTPCDLLFSSFSLA